MNKIFKRLIEARGLNSDFLHPEYEKLVDPFLLPDMEQAVGRIMLAIKGREKIMIYGDYDADGVTSSVLMENTLKLAGAKDEQINIMLPDRFIDGYGMSERLVDSAKKQGVSLVITVDCGSRNHEIIEKLQNLGIDTVVTDHHECADTLPEAVAVVNPKRKDFSGPATLKELAGVGVAFKLAAALEQRQYIPHGQEKWLLDLVAIGTICDSMLLTGENRILCSFGFKVLEKTRRPGLRELMKKSGVASINSESIGFQIGPRINAAGRLESASLAMDLLRTSSAATAASLADKLETLNKRRRQEQDAAMKEISKKGITNEPVIIEVGKWHEGILGIIAGRLVETYKKPAFALAEIQDEKLKGSGRSFGDFSLAEALKQVNDKLISGGGHAGAAGVCLEKANLQEFTAGMNNYYKSLKLTGQEIFFKKHSDLSIDDFSELTLDLIDELKTLEPFGPGNEEPILSLENIIVESVTRMGTDRNHLRLDIKDRDGRKFKLVAFFAPDAWFSLEPGLSYNLLIKVTQNEFQGTRSVEGRLIDVADAELD